MTKKENYVAPKLELLSLNNEDIIMTSGEPQPTPVAIITTGVEIGRVNAANEIFK